jgi:hypothetical protein
MISTIAYDPARWHVLRRVRRRLRRPARPRVRRDLLQPRTDPQRQAPTRSSHRDPRLLRLPAGCQPPHPPARAHQHRSRHRPSDLRRRTRRTRPAGPPPLERRRKRPAQLATQPTDTSSPHRSARDPGRPGHAHHQQRRPLLARRRNDHRNNIRTRQQLGPPRRNQTLTRRRRRPTTARRSRPDCARRAKCTSLANQASPNGTGRQPGRKSTDRHKRPLKHVTDRLRGRAVAAVGGADVLPNE